MEQKKQNWFRRNIFSLYTVEPLYHGSVFSLLFMTTVVVVSAISHLCKFPIGIWTAPLAFSISVLIFYHLGTRGLRGNKLRGIASFVFNFIILVFICGLFYDMTWDGNLYHKQAIGCLADGWNPMYESLDAAWTRLGVAGKLNSYAIWGDHYAKATWFFAAAIYKISGNIECGKAMQPLLMLALYGILRHYLAQQKNLKRKQAKMFAVLTVVNPISVSQLFTYYNDAVLLSVLFLVIICSAALLDRSYKPPKGYLWSALACSVLLCSNIKFTGLAYAGIFSVLFYVLMVVHEQKGKKIYAAVKLAIRYAAIFICAVLIIGSSTFVKNTVEHGNPFYPLYGEGKVDIMTDFQPESFEDISTPEKLFRATFSRSATIIRSYGTEPQLKIPFTIFPSEFLTSAAVDTRIGGFGPWFSGLLLISLPLLIWALLSLKKHDSFKFTILLSLLVLIAGLLFSLTDSWWARYSPYFYIIVLLGLFILYFLRNTREKNIDTQEENITKKRTKHICRLQRFFVFAMILNTAFFLPGLGKNIGGSALVHMQNIEIIKESQKKNGGALKVYFDPVLRRVGVFYNLRDIGVDFEVVTQKPVHSKSYYTVAIDYESDGEEKWIVQKIQSLMD